MRIIGGEFRNRRLKSIKTDELRPATDRYRETLFNILNNLIDFEMIDVCDLYAGTGAVGFECLSRGANSCTFVEKNFKTYKLIYENADILGVKERVKIFKDSAENFTKNTQQKFDLIFADPPYKSNTIYLVFRNVLERNLINQNGILVIQRSKSSKEEDIREFKMEPFKIIGDDVIYLKKFDEIK